MRQTNRRYKLRSLIAVASFLTTVSGTVWALSAAQIIKLLDQNEEFKTHKFSAVMKIKKGSRTLTKTFTGYGSANGDKSYMEFTNPEDIGVKYLKIKKELWIYFPDADDIMKISGHMLRQGMMGSDISYEDMLESGEREEKYKASLTGTEKVDGRTCYVIELNAKTNDATYDKEKVLVDMQRFVALRVEFYARGGRLIKKMSMSDVRQVGGRWVPFLVTIQDMRKRNTETTMQFTSLVYNAGLPAGVFSKSYLRR